MSFWVFVPEPSTPPFGGAFSVLPASPDGAGELKIANASAARGRNLPEPARVLLGRFVPGLGLARAGGAAANKEGTTVMKRLGAASALALLVAACVADAQQTQQGQIEACPPGETTTTGAPCPPGEEAGQEGQTTTGTGQGGQSEQGMTGAATGGGAAGGGGQSQ